MVSRCCCGLRACKCNKIRDQEEICYEVEEDLYDSCRYELPCNTCVCFDETESCSPIILDCGDTECIEKPKKGFWQQLFGSDKKFCQCLKKKPSCRCKKPKKRICKCVPNCQDLKCQEIKEEMQSNSCISCHSKLNVCTQKPCMPSKKSICGCHFYINLENRPTRKTCNCKKTSPVGKEACTESGSFENYRYNIHEEPVRDNESGCLPKCQSKNKEQKLVDINQPSNQQRRSISSRNSKLPKDFSHKLNQQERPICCRKIKLVKDCKEKESSDVGNVHIGLTVTKEETKYYKPNVPIDSCANNKDNDGCVMKSSLCEESHGNDDKITLELINSKVTLLKNSDCERSSNAVKGENAANINRRTTNQNASSTQREPSRSDKICHSSRHNRKSRVSGNNIVDLDQRVSEILRKLDGIEQKISTLEKKNAENKGIRIDFDGQKSTVSLHLNEFQRGMKCCPSNKGEKKKDKHLKGQTIIEIKRSKSLSCITARNECPTNKKRVLSKSLDRRSKTKNSCHKIIISLPSNKDKSRQLVVKPENTSCLGNTKSKSDLSWCDISKELQMRSPKRVCYCLTCCRKRTRC